MQSELIPITDPRKTDKFGAVLLAAGEGLRMGSVPKSLLQLDGLSLIQRHLIALRKAGLDEIVVVTGYHYQAIETALNDQAVRVVRNPEPQRGQQSSVRLGSRRWGEALISSWSCWQISRWLM